MQVIVQ